MYSTVFDFVDISVTGPRAGGYSTVYSEHQQKVSSPYYSAHCLVWAGGGGRYVNIDLLNKHLKIIHHYYRDRCTLAEIFL